MSRDEKERAIRRFSSDGLILVTKAIVFGRNNEPFALTSPSINGFNNVNLVR
jgi:hypothetical protein